MLTIGIDPGITGAIAVFDGRGVCCFDMPSDTLFRGKSAKRRLDFGALCDLIGRLGEMQPALCLIEEMQGVAGQGADASLQLGRAWAAAEMAVVASKIPYQHVTPSIWKAALRVPHKGTYRERKAASRATASALLPQARQSWPLVEHAGRAEAALIAVYAHRLAAGLGKEALA